MPWGAQGAAGWEMGGPPVGGCNYSSQDQGLAADLGFTLDRITSGRSVSALPSKYMGLVQSAMPTIGLVTAYTRVMGYFLRG